MASDHVGILLRLIHIIYKTHIHTQQVFNTSKHKKAQNYCDKNLRYRISSVFLKTLNVGGENCTSWQVLSILISLCYLLLLVESVHILGKIHGFAQLMRWTVELSCRVDSYFFFALCDSSLIHCGRKNEYKLIPAQSSAIWIYMLLFHSARFASFFPKINENM